MNYVAHNFANVAVIIVAMGSLIALVLAVIRFSDARRERREMLEVISEDLDFNPEQHENYR